MSHPFGFSSSSWICVSSDLAETSDMVSIESLPRVSKDKQKMAPSVLQKLSLPHFNMQAYLPRSFIKVAPVPRSAALPFILRRYLPALMLTSICSNTNQCNERENCLTATQNKVGGLRSTASIMFSLAPWFEVVSVSWEDLPSRRLESPSRSGVSAIIDRWPGRGKLNYFFLFI